MDQLSALHWILIGAGIDLLVCGGLGAYVADQKGRSGAIATDSVRAVSRPR
jgi:hypothetical protein